MNQTRTLRKQLVWQGGVGQVRAAVWEFERMRIFNAGSVRAVEGAVFVDRAVVLNLGRQGGVWLSMADVRSVREVFDRMDADAGDAPNDAGSKERDWHADLAWRAVQSLLTPQVPGSAGLAEKDARLAQYRRVILSSMQFAREPPSDACTRAEACTQGQLAVAETRSSTPALPWRGVADEADNPLMEDTQGDEEVGERQRVIREVIWRDFAPLRFLCDARKLPEVVKAEHPVSPLYLTQWVNDTRYGEGKPEE